MSVKSWMKEFYPVEASEVPEKDAAAHSLNKWEGALKKNLKRHKIDVVPIDFDSDTCALCRRYMFRAGQPMCHGCPPGEYLGKSCDYDDTTPYRAWDFDLDPNPMIRALRAVVKAGSQ